MLAPSSEYRQSSRKLDGHAAESAWIDRPPKRRRRGPAAEERRGPIDPCASLSVAGVPGEVGELGGGPSLFPLPYLNKEGLGSWEGVRLEVNCNTAVVRRKLGKSPYGQGGKRAEVKGFSARSQGRVKAAAADAAPALVSQFALTYHTEEPDGKEAKEQLHAWFVHLRRVLPGVGYL